MDPVYTHRPVLLNECIENLRVHPNGVYVDGTLGRGGHSLEIAKKLEKGRLIAIDCDDEAIAAAKKILSQYQDKVTFVRGNFRDLDEILKQADAETVDGMLFDLGVSSPQLDDQKRGFSYMQDAELDMRMDRSSSLTAKEIVNHWSASELKKIFYEYGEERYAAAISNAIVREREKKPIETTSELVDIIKKAMPASARKEKQHPAKRSFQALRIAVNGELANLDRLMQTAVSHLNPGGRLCIITFHSLEDRIVKSAMNDQAKGCTCPPDFPVCVCGNKPKIRIITKKPILPSDAEIMENPRARSAKLRVCEKI